MHPYTVVDEDTSHRTNDENCAGGREAVIHQDRNASSPAGVNAEDSHREALAHAKNDIALIRYAVEVLDGAPPAEVSAWLKRYGYTPSPRKVLAEVKAYRDSHRTNGITVASTQPTFAPGFLRDNRQFD